MFDMNLTPRYSETKITIDDVKAKLDRDMVNTPNDDSGVQWLKKLEAFYTFLRLLDWSKTELFYVESVSRSSGHTGWKVYHYSEKVPDPKPKFGWARDVFSTWFGLSAFMS